MVARQQKPILITGCHRSGSTWLGKMLGSAPNTMVVWEPFNIIRFAYGLNGLAKHWFAYAPALPQHEAKAAFQRVLDGKTGRTFRPRDPKRFIPMLRKGRPIIKDPIASLSSEWLAENFDLDIVVLVRHPAAFASSLKRLNWTFDFDAFLAQEALMAGPLAPHRDEIERKPEDIIDQAALLWKCLYGTLFEYMDRHPEWIVRTHEELSLNPVEKLEELYRLLNLEWTDEARLAIQDHSGQGKGSFDPKGQSHQLKRDSAANTVAWKKLLTQEETETIYQRTSALASRFYSEDAW